MILIKKYANGRFFDSVNKKYLTRYQISELVNSGEKIRIINTKTGEDLTKSIVTKLPAQKEFSPQEPSGVLVKLLKKGGGTLLDYIKKSASLWQSILTNAEEDIDKLVRQFVSNREISEAEGRKLKKEISGYASSIQNWMAEKIDHRINEVLALMNLASRDQIIYLTTQIESLNKKVEKIEKNKKIKKGTE